MVRVFGVALTAFLSLVMFSSSEVGVRADDKTEGEAKKENESLKVADELTSDDPNDKVMKKSRVKSYDFKMEEGAIYVIDLKSKAFDAYLRLEDPTGKEVAQNDDDPNGNGTFDSRIVYKAPKTGAYKIHATSLDGKMGKFALTARKGTQQDLDEADPHAALIGKAAPEITGDHILNGKTKKLSDLKGKVVLLDFWAVWCGPCIATFPHLKKMSKEHGPDGLEILGVTTYYEVFGFDKTKKSLTRLKDEKLSKADEQQMLEDFTGHHKLTHQLMTVSKAEWGASGKAYGVRGIPQVVVIDRKGAVRMIKVGSGPANAKAVEEQIVELLKEKAAN